MLSALDYVLWFAGISASLFVAFLSLKRRVFRHFLALNLYFLTVAVIGLARFWCSEATDSPLSSFQTGPLPSPALTNRLILAQRLCR